MLYAVDELTGLIGAAIRMRPSKSTSDFEVKSLKKKFKDKKFAAGRSRDVIKFGAQLLEWDLDKLFEQTIIAMRSCEDGVKSESFYENDAIPDIGALFGVIPFEYRNQNDVVTRFYDLSKIEAKDKNWQDTYASKLDSKGFFYDGIREDKTNNITYYMYYNSPSYDFNEYDNVMFGVYDFQDGQQFLVVAYKNGNGKSIV